MKCNVVILHQWFITHSLVFEIAMIFIQVIKNPISNHLPTGCSKIGTSYHADQIVDVGKLAEDKPMVFVIGAMAHGKVIL